MSEMCVQVNEMCVALYRTGSTEAGRWLEEFTRQPCCLGTVVVLLQNASTSAECAFFCANTLNAKVRSTPVSPEQSLELLHLCLLLLARNASHAVAVQICMCVEGLLTRGANLLHLLQEPSFCSMDGAQQIQLLDILADCSERGVSGKHNDKLVSGWSSAEVGGVLNFLLPVVTANSPDAIRCMAAWYRTDSFSLRFVHFAEQPLFRHLLTNMSDGSDASVKENSMRLLAAALGKDVQHEIQEQVDTEACIAVIQNITQLMQQMQQMLGSSKFLPLRNAMAALVAMLVKARAATVVQLPSPHGCEASGNRDIIWLA